MPSISKGSNESMELKYYWSLLEMNCNISGEEIQLYHVNQDFVYLNSHQSEQIQAEAVSICAKSD